MNFNTGEQKMKERLRDLFIIPKLDVCWWCLNEHCHCHHTMKGGGGGCHLCEPSSWTRGLIYIQLLSLGVWNEKIKCIMKIECDELVFCSTSVWLVFIFKKEKKKIIHFRMYCMGCFHEVRDNIWLLALVLWIYRKEIFNEWLAFGILFINSFIELL